MINKILVLIIGVLFVDICALGSESVTNELDRVRDALCNVIRDVYPDPYAHNTVLEYGVCDVENPTYREFAAEVAACYEDVLMHLDACATRQVERLLILSVRDQFDDRFYISFCNRVADLATKGIVTRDELLWTVFPVGSAYERYLVRSYRDPATRMLLKKLQRVDGASGEYYKEVLSGKAYKEYVKQVESGLIKDPLVSIRDYPTAQIVVSILAVVIAISGALVLLHRRH